MMAGKKRKAEAARLEEADRALYGAFRGAANSLSQFYTLSMGHQKLSFLAGERHALEKLYQWILRQHEDGSRLTVADIASHIQHEIEHAGDDASASPRLQYANLDPQCTMHFPNSSSQQAPSSVNTPANLGVTQSKNSVFSNALSSPVRRSLQPYHLEQGGGGGGYFSSATLPAGNRESNSGGSIDSSMDMHSD